MPMSRTFRAISVLTACVLVLLVLLGWVVWAPAVRIGVRHELVPGRVNPLVEAMQTAQTEEEALGAVAAYGEEWANSRSFSTSQSTPLHMAAQHQTPVVLAALLEVGAEVDARDAYGGTPLRRAVMADRAENVEFLLSRGADPSAATRRGSTPLSAAEASGKEEILRILRAHMREESP